MDDINLILEGYSRIIEKYTFPNVEVQSIVVTNCDAAWEKIKADSIHLAILDLNFPLDSYGEMGYREALGIKIRAHFPDIKLIILTEITDRVRIADLIKNIRPEGFLIKGETNSQEIFRSLKTVLTGKKYYSSSLDQILQLVIK